ncbi:hypothetical protein [Burkholderia gladioli]|uniref:hypothetical protein n=1 Tax=Burkholderia gladioli TaxID=28095 RepID=UPI001FC87DD2|nr:hypothetical protein [Burkholderia gladioli]
MSIDLGLDGIEARSLVHQPRNSGYSIIRVSGANRNADLITPLPFGFIRHAPRQANAAADSLRVRHLQQFVTGDVDALPGF